jgi:HAD superfamily hydrolase (TIGR01662 family)
VVKDGVSTILFDFDGTLVFHEPDSFDLISAYCAEIGQPLSLDAEHRGRRKRHEYFVDPLIRQRLHNLSREDFWQHFNRHLLKGMGIRGDLDRQAAELTNRYMETKFAYQCPEAGCRTLAVLRERGYELGLITNRDNVERFYELLDEMALRSYFDVTLASGEVGIRKPEPGIFFAALDRLAARPPRSVYIGDNYWADVVGAQRAGLAPVLLDPHGIFPECDCPIVERVDALLEWL